MVAIEEIEQKLLALPLKHRVFLPESLLGSVPPVDKELTEAEEMAEVDRRERQIETGQVRALTERGHPLGRVSTSKKVLVPNCLSSSG